MAENLDWLYEYLLQFLKSPGWRVPILNFIDQHCYQFEDTSENKLVYTEIHNKFKELIDQLLENLCITLGISQEQFLKVSQQGIHNPSHKRVFEQMLACDNFVSFKKLMLKRNKELEAEAAKNIEKKPPQKANEEAELALATTISLKEAEERKRLEDKYNEELRLAMKLSEEEFKSHLSAASEIEEAEKRKKDIFEQAELREKARLLALKEEAEKMKKQRLEEEQRLEAIKQEELKIKKLIEDKKTEEKKNEEASNTELKQRELQAQIKAAEAERLKKENEAQKLLQEQSELLKKIQEAENRRKAEEIELEEKNKKKAEKKKAKELAALQEQERIRNEEIKKQELLEQQRLSIREEEKRIDLEKQRLKEEAQRLEEERIKFEALQKEKQRKRAEKIRAQEELQKKAEEDRLRLLEAEEQKKIEEENERIKKLQIENEKLKQIMTEKKIKKKVKIPKKIEIGEVGTVGIKNYEKELNFDESTEKEIKTMQDQVIRQQENESAVKVKSSLPPVNVKMGLMSGISLPSESLENSPEKKGGESLEERAARLKAQRDALLAAKRKQRDDAFKEYIHEGGADLNKKATPAVSNDELEKRKQVLMKIKSYNEED